MDDVQNTSHTVTQYRCQNLLRLNFYCGSNIPLRKCGAHLPEDLETKSSEPHAKDGPP